METLAKGKTISKINISKPSSSERIIFYLKINWNEHPFSVRLIGDNESWYGSLTDDAIRELSVEARETEETYIAHLKNAFVYKSYDYVHEFVQGNSECGEFTWKKKFADAIMIHGSIMLVRDQNITKNELIDDLLQTSSSLKSKLADSVNNYKLLQQELSSCKLDWEEDVKLKNIMENDLYSRFNKLLNTKKRKIQELEQKVSKLTDSKEVINLSMGADSN